MHWKACTVFFMTQPISENVGHASEKWKMFVCQEMHNLCDFCLAVMSELSFSVVIGVVTVCMVGFLLIPHWTVVLSVCGFFDHLFVH